MIHRVKSIMKNKAHWPIGVYPLQFGLALWNRFIQMFDEFDQLNL